jgi:hypothetical protein
MSIGTDALNEVIHAADAWSNNWAWGLPLIASTVLLHGVGLVLVQKHIVLRLSRKFGHRRSVVGFAFVAAASALLLTILLGIEAGAWAAAYVALGARPDFASAMLYSLSAMTSYGHANVYLAEHWQLMGALEALNGMMLFGMTTAFLVSMLQSHWPEQLSKGPRR